MNNRFNINQFFDEFFYFISKIIFFLPIFFLIFGLLIKFNQTKEKEPFNNIFLTPTLIIKPSSSPTVAKIDFNLNGPLICSFSQNNASVSAYIKEKKIKIVLEEKGSKSYFLVNNDCLYQWQENQFTGNKSCGINQYLDLMETLFKDNQDLFLNFFFKRKEMSNFTRSNDFSLSKICKKKDFEDKLFLIPETILFKNTKLNF